MTIVLKLIYGIYETREKKAVNPQNFTIISLQPFLATRYLLNISSNLLITIDEIEFLNCTYSRTVCVSHASREPRVQNSVRYGGFA
ncbi:hypothetical protein BpHYR1_040248 [Brachionus plicatilis]|uniref:Uncharacterized protein n=1 Tax=Brachionus plicatilis TaxID=10195 RepID=A0A3M7SEL7_BRAPC|nr:hypothetical protein BpHYR1_040248 [Brachionus plicatilis]